MKHSVKDDVMHSGATEGQTVAGQTQALQEVHHIQGQKTQYLLAIQWQGAVAALPGAPAALQRLSRHVAHCVNGHQMHIKCSAQ